jgi:hypothetical protein
MNSSELNSSFETKPFSCRPIDEFNNELNSCELNWTYETGLRVKLESLLVGTATAGNKIIYTSVFEPKHTLLNFCLSFEEP